MLEVMPNEHPEVRCYSRHTLPLPSCCPVSGNPQPGSQVRITYRPQLSVLEVYSLTAYLAEYVGGHSNGVRTMEAMIQQIATDCADLLGVPVTVFAKVLLESGRLDLLARAG